MELFESLTVQENVALGPEAAYSGRRPWSQLVQSRREPMDIRSRTLEALRACDLMSLADKPVGTCLLANEGWWSSLVPLRARSGFFSLMNLRRDSTRRKRNSLAGY